MYTHAHVPTLVWTYTLIGMQHTHMRKIKIKKDESQCLNYFVLDFPGSPDAVLQTPQLSRGCSHGKGWKEPGPPWLALSTFPEQSCPYGNQQPQVAVALKWWLYVHSNYYIRADTECFHLCQAEQCPSIGHTLILDCGNMSYYMAKNLRQHIEIKLLWLDLKIEQLSHITSWAQYNLRSP